jgi:hypothetical protein
MWLRCVSVCQGGRADVAGAGQAHGGEDCRDHASWLVSAPMARNMAGPETSLTAK